MSQPPAAGSPPTSVDDRPHRFRQQSTPHMSPVHQRPSTHPLQREPAFDGPVSQALSLPPLRQLSSTPPTPSDRRTGNPLGVHSILNPQADLAEQQRNRRRSASQLESPSPVETQPSQSLPSISRPTSVDSTQDDGLPNRSFPPPGRPTRHVPSPRSPSLHRTQSLGTLNPPVLNPPTGTIDAHQSPFLSASTRSYDPITAQSALPTPPAGGRPTYFPSVPPTAPTPPPNLSRGEAHRPFPQSGTASPIASFSPHSRAASIASSQFEGPGQQSAYASVPPSSHGEGNRIPMETERNMIHMAPSGQSSIQLMTITSQQGHHVQIPVDVQAASKVADEKRKRNAGASARFRARRKEKEREASMSITRLEQQLREAIEDLDFYRTERDYFKSIVFQQPGAERHYGRPPSPRLRRLSTAPSNAPSSTTGGGSGSPYSAYEEEPRESERNVRRRTSNYHPPSGPPPPQANASGPPPQSFSTQFPPMNTGPGPAMHQNRTQSTQQYNMHEQQPPSEQPIYRNPFASDPARYEARNWTPAHENQR